MLARATIYRDSQERNKKKTLFSFPLPLDSTPIPAKAPPALEPEKPT